jgi:hypothetical protein
MRMGWRSWSNSGFTVTHWSYKGTVTRSRFAIKHLPAMPKRACPARTERDASEVSRVPDDSAHWTQNGYVTGFYLLLKPSCSNPNSMMDTYPMQIFEDSKCTQGVRWNDHGTPLCHLVWSNILVQVCWPSFNKFRSSLMYNCFGLSGNGQRCLMDLIQRKYIKMTILFGGGLQWDKNTTYIYLDLLRSGNRVLD